jgi:malonate transporter and related proteins
MNGVEPIVMGLLPVFIVIAAGWIARASKMVPEDAWVGINRLSYFVLFPAFLFSIIARTDFSASEAGAVVGAGLAGFVTMGVIALLCLPLTRGDGPAFTSVFQASIRWNGFVVLAAAEGVLGREGAGLVALVFGPAVPIINVLCVIVLSVWGAGTKVDAAGVVRRIVTNPLILACIAGLIANLSGLPRLGPVEAALEIIGRGALAAGLMSVGAGLDLSAVRARPGLLALASALKLVVAPIVFILWGKAIGLDGVALVALAAVGTSPGAAASYVLAREMGGDARLTAGHVTVTTVLAAFAIPFWLIVAGQL